MADMNNENTSSLETKKDDASVKQLKVSVPDFGGTGGWTKADDSLTDSKETSQTKVPNVDNKANDTSKKDADKGNFRKGIEKLKSKLSEKQSENEKIIAMYRDLEAKNAELERLVKQPVERHNFNSDVEMIRHVQQLDNDKREIARNKQELEQRFQRNTNDAGALTYEEKIHNCYETPEEIKRFKDKMAANASIQIQPHVAQFIVASDVGPRIAEHFADHPEELKEINSLHPEIAKMELALIRRDIKKNFTKSVGSRQSSAPGPVGSPSSTAGAGTDKNSLSFAEQLKLYRKKHGR